MIEAFVQMDLRLQPRMPESLQDGFGQARVAGCWIRDLVKRLGKTTKVMHGRQQPGRAHARAFGTEVR